MCAGCRSYQLRHTNSHSLCPWPTTTRPALRALALWLWTRPCLPWPTPSLSRESSASGWVPLRCSVVAQLLCRLRPCPPAAAPPAAAHLPPCPQSNDLEAAVQLFAEVLEVRVQHYGGKHRRLSSACRALTEVRSAAVSEPTPAGSLLLPLPHRRPGPRVRLRLLALRRRAAVPGAGLGGCVWRRQLEGGRWRGRRRCGRRGGRRGRGG